MPSWPIFGADAAEVLLLVLEQLDGFDDDGIGKEVAPEDGLLEDGVEFGVALFEGAGEAVAGGVEELGFGRGGEHGGGSGGEGGAEEVASVGSQVRAQVQAHWSYLWKGSRKQAASVIEKDLGWPFRPKPLALDSLGLGSI